MRQEKIQKLQLETSKDETLQLPRATILECWPEEGSKPPPQLTPFYDIRDEFGVYDGLVFKGERLVVPQGLRAEIKKEIHVEAAVKSGKKLLRKTAKGDDDFSLGFSLGTCDTQYSMTRYWQ